MDEILVACEGVPALFRFQLGEPSKAKQVILLKGNALGVTFVNARNAAVVSIDHVHAPGSTAEMRGGQVCCHRQSRDLVKLTKDDSNRLVCSSSRLSMTKSGVKMKGYSQL